MAAAGDPVKVFISYSHDNEAHTQRVRKLSDRLRAEGVECEIDQYEVAPPEGWRKWMDGRIAWADYVVMVCTETYHRRVRGDEKPGRGRGVTYEGAILLDLLYAAGMRNDRTIPVLFEGADAKDVPIPLQPYTRYRLWEEYDDLYRHLTGQPRIVRPELGPARERASERPAWPARLFPDLQPYLGDRTEQDKAVAEAIDRARSAPTARPIVAFVFGDDRQCHDMLVERLREKTLHPLLGLPRDSLVEVHHLAWPSRLHARDEIRRRLQEEVAEKVLDRRSDDVWEINAALGRGPVVVHAHLPRSPAQPRSPAWPWPGRSPSSCGCNTGSSTPPTCSTSTVRSTSTSCRS